MNKLEKGSRPPKDLILETVETETHIFRAEKKQVRPAQFSVCVN